MIDDDSLEEFRDGKRLPILSDISGQGKVTRRNAQKVAVKLPNSKHNDALKREMFKRETKAL